MAALVMPGDAGPSAVALAIDQLTQERNPPLRLLLGSDAYAAAEKNDLARLEEARIWRKLGVSTDLRRSEEAANIKQENPKRAKVAMVRLGSLSNS